MIILVLALILFYYKMHEALFKNELNLFFGPYKKTTKTLTSNYCLNSMKNLKKWLFLSYITWMILFFYTVVLL